MTAYDSGIRSYRCTTTENRRFVFILATDGGTGVDDIGEHHRRSEEHIVLTFDARIDGYVVLHFDAIADLHVVGYSHVLAKRAVFTDSGTFLYMTKIAEPQKTCEIAVAIAAPNTPKPNTYINT